MSLTLSRAAAPRPAVSYRLVLISVGAALCAAGFLATGQDTAGPAARAAGPELAHLLRMMALVKLALAAGAAWLVDWRLRLPVTPRLAAAYVTGAGLMAAGPGLVWGLAHVITGAVLLHTGMVLLIALGCTDGGIAWFKPRERPASWRG